MTNKAILIFAAPAPVRIRFRPVATRARHDGWTVQRQGDFIAALAALPWWQSYRVQGAALVALTVLVVVLFW